MKVISCDFLKKDLFILFGSQSYRGSSIHWHTPQMVTISRAGLAQNSEKTGASSGFSVWVQEPKDLDHFFRPSKMLAEGWSGNGAAGTPQMRCPGGLACYATAKALTSCSLTLVFSLCLYSYGTVIFLLVICCILCFMVH